MDKSNKIRELEKENAELREQLKAQEEKVLNLLDLLDKQNVKKDSRNSHNPPSGDKSPPRRNKSLREKTGRKPGGQLGHKGHTLEMKSVPNKIEDLKSNFCNSCGGDLAGLEQAVLSKRQEVILPPINPEYIEYRQWGCKCPCGHDQRAPYPKGIDAPIQYGGDIAALISYLNVYQYVPYRRLKGMLRDVFGLSLSEGSIRNILEKTAKKCAPIHGVILEQIKESAYVGADETGMKVNGEKWWAWVWQNVKNTFITASSTRGFAAVEEVLPEGLPNCVVGSDRWAAQLKTVSKNKQLCLPHLFRDLNFLIESEKNSWASHFKNLLKNALDLRQKADKRGKAFRKKEREAYELEQALNRLLARAIPKEQDKLTYSFQKQMIKLKHYLFTFLYNLEVPPDNNGSERAIRNIKVKQKISGQFKSGQYTFCVLRSIIDTLIKRGLNPLLFLRQISIVF